MELAGSEEKQLVFESEPPRRLFFSDYRQTSSKEDALTELGSDDASIDRLRGRLGKGLKLEVKVLYRLGSCRG